MTKEYDLVILGGGTGGYVAAIRAQQLGMNVAVVEKEKLGGTCLHNGCIPSKALLRTAQLYREMKQSSMFGIQTDKLVLDFSEAQNRKNKVIDTLHQGVQSLLKKAKIDVYHGFGRILGSSIFSPIPGTISIEYENGTENTMLVPKNILIATGSKPRLIPELPIDGDKILHSDQALQLDQLPTSMAIIGGGVIGIEWASLLQDLGVQVTVIESNETILATEDVDIRKELQSSLEKRGVTFITNAQIDAKKLAINDSNVSISVKQAEEESILVEAEKILISVGRDANINEIGLNNTSIQMRNGFIETNKVYQTKETHIYAIGDCIGGMQLAHVASEEGIIAVEHMAEKNPAPLNPLHIPACIYSYPEVAKVGLTEQSAIDQGFSLKVGKFPFQGIGKAHVNGDTTGFVKIIVDEQTDDVLGVHMVGAHVTDMISEAALAKILDATAWEISKTVHPHPSLSESILEASLAVDQLQIHG
ncbi:dihydrolipoyl dehydrogenase [Pseudogracilibacillus sp. SO30301A]|uniref:dihydrolipoyl dehydrogenase n=1 Tax=Pseudogracilibacillus sp. SO30301A TaxID=3098291 RepID=UPI00300E597B